MASDDDDDALLQRFRQGEQEAFTRLVMRYRKPVYNAAYWVLHHAEDAAEVTQVVFLKVVERLDDYNPQYRFFSWIYRIAVNEALNVLRRHGREEPLAEDFDLEDTDAASPEQQLEQSQRSRRVQAAVAQLSAEHRVVIMLRHYTELGYDDIARVLEIEEKTVKSRLFEARNKLRRLLEGQP